MRKPPRFPSYDRRTDGNPFEWILRAAGEIRATEAIERAKDREVQRELHQKWLAKMRRDSAR
jgi:hypothetical protein